MPFKFIPGSNVEVPEIPFKIKVNIDPQKTALIIVDMQNDFVKDKGTLLVDSAKDTIINLHDLISIAKKNNVKIIYTQDTHFENDPEWKIWPEHCRINTWGWQIIDDLKTDEADLIVQKNRYDGFYGSNLEHYIKNVWHIENLIITGTVSSICVLHTAASAGLRWFNIIVPANAISALTEFDQALTLRQVSSLYNGVVVKDVKDIIFT